MHALTTSSTTRASDRKFRRWARFAASWLAWLLRSWVALAVVAPVVVVAASLRSPDREVWSLLARTTLLRMSLTTLLLGLGVAIGTALIGSALAWLVVSTTFPGHAVFRRLLVLPMALPSYVVAFVYVGLLQFAGPVQTAWRDLFGVDAWFPPIRTPVGAGIVFVLTLYPYVYLPALVAFTQRSAGPAAAARTLGLGPVATWWRVVLPCARPAVAAGAALVVMETVTDVGVARAFSVQTLGDGVLRVWFGLDRRGAAGELAMMIVGVVVLLVSIERISRGNRRYAQVGRSAAGTPRARLRGARAAAAVAACASVLLLAAGIPLATLVSWAITARRRDSEGALDARFGQLMSTTLTLALATAGICAALGLLLALRSRAHQVGSGRLASTIGRWSARISSVGYAVPGLVVAAGTLTVLAFLDERLDALASWDDRLYVPFLLVGSTAGVVYAMTVRFVAVAKENVDAGLQRIDPRVLGAASTLGAGPLRRFGRVELPLLRSSIVAALLLVGVDAMKELPATLLLRPAGRDTLSVFVWNMTNESRWEEAATPALAIFVLSLPLVVVLLRRVGR